MIFNDTICELNSSAFCSTYSVFVMELLYVMFCVLMYIVADVTKLIYVVCCVLLYIVANVMQQIYVM